MQTKVEASEKAERNRTLYGILEITQIENR